MPETSGAGGRARAAQRNFPAAAVAGLLQADELIGRSAKGRSSRGRYDRHVEHRGPRESGGERFPPAAQCHSGRNGFPGSERVIVAAKGVAHQRQIEAAALLRLPDVGHLVNEECPGAAAAHSKNRPTTRRPRGGTRCCPSGAIAASPRLERPPFALEQPHLRIVDRVAEYRTRQIDFSPAVSERLSIALST